MSYLVEGRIFPLGEEAEEMLANQKTDRDAVETSAEMERNTLLLYMELMRFVPESQQDILEDIVAEERQHLMDFTRYKEKHFG
jgi:rubrerythrin